MLTMTVTAYDKGMVNVDGIPMSDGQDQAEAWLRAAMLQIQMLE
jgi:hypothetical protein